MKKTNLLLALVSVAIAPVFAFEINFDDFADSLKGEIPFYQKMATCTAATDSSGAFKILGTANGKCHYYKGVYIGPDNKQYPLNDCYAPLSVMKSYADKQIKDINNMISSKNFSLNYDLQKDELNQYCKSVSHTININ